MPPERGAFSSPFSLNFFNHRVTLRRAQGRQRVQRFGIGWREEADGRSLISSEERRAFNAEGRRPPIRADRRGPQGITWIWVLSKEIKALNHRGHRAAQRKSLLLG